MRLDHALQDRPQRLLGLVSRNMPVRAGRTRGLGRGLAFGSWIGLSATFSYYAGAMVFYMLAMLTAGFVVAKYDADETLIPLAPVVAVPALMTLVSAASLWWAVREQRRSSAFDAQRQVTWNLAYQVLTRAVPHLDDVATTISQRRPPDPTGQWLWQVEGSALGRKVVLIGRSSPSTLQVELRHDEQESFSLEACRGKDGKWRIGHRSLDTGVAGVLADHVGRRLSQLVGDREGGRVVSTLQVPVGAPDVFHQSADERSPRWVDASDRQVPGRAGYLAYSWAIGLSSAAALGLAGAFWTLATTGPTWWPPWAAIGLVGLGGAMFVASRGLRLRPPNAMRSLHSVELDHRRATVWWDGTSLGTDGQSASIDLTRRFNVNLYRTAVAGLVLELIQTGDTAATATRLRFVVEAAPELVGELPTLDVGDSASPIDPTLFTERLWPTVAHHAAVHGQEVVGATVARAVAG